MTERSTELFLNSTTLRRHNGHARTKKPRIYGSLSYAVALLRRYGWRLATSPTTLLELPRCLLAWLPMLLRGDRAISEALGISIYQVIQARQELRTIGLPVDLAQLAKGTSQEIPPAYFSPLWGPLLYTSVRARRPVNIVETGVAHGVSTAHILAALEENQVGTLHSIDKPGLSPFLKGSERKRIAAQIHAMFVPHRWRLPDNPRWKIQEARITPASLGQLLQSIGKVDLFIHDSDHTGDNVLMELETAWSFLRPGGMIIVDDVIPDDSGLRRFMASLEPGSYATTRLGPVAIVRRSRALDSAEALG